MKRLLIIPLIILSSANAQENHINALQGIVVCDLEKIGSSETNKLVRTRLQAYKWAIPDSARYACVQWPVALTSRPFLKVEELDARSGVAGVTVTIEVIAYSDLFSQKGRWVIPWRWTKTKLFSDSPNNLQEATNSLVLEAIDQLVADYNTANP